jgi:hypothetical protein
LLTVVADNRRVNFAGRVIVLVAVAAAAVVALGAGAAAREDAWLVFTASPNHGGQARSCSVSTLQARG